MLGAMSSRLWVAFQSFKTVKAFISFSEKLEAFNGFVMLATMVSAVAEVLSVIILPTSSFVQSFFGANNPSILIALSFGR